MHKKVLERLEQVKSQTNDAFGNKEKSNLLTNVVYC